MYCIHMNVIKPRYLYCTKSTCFHVYKLINVCTFMHLQSLINFNIIYIIYVYVCVECMYAVLINNRSPKI